MERRLSTIDLYEIYSKWFEGTYYFQCFVRSTNFVSLKQYPDFLLSQVSSNEDDFAIEVQQSVDKYLSKNTLYFFDFPALEGIKTGYFVHKNKKIKPVITFNNILHPNGLIGDKEYINGLIGYGELIENKEIITYSFILDSNRYGNYEKEAYKRFFNNQYEMTNEDLPSYEMLQWLRLNKCIYLYRDEVKEDMDAYLQYLEDSGMDIVKENLGG